VPGFEDGMRLSLHRPANLMRILGGGLNARENFGDVLDRKVFHGATLRRHLCGRQGPTPASRTGSIPVSGPGAIHENRGADDPPRRSSSYYHKRRDFSWKHPLSVSDRRANEPTALGPSCGLVASHSWLVLGFDVRSCRSAEQ